jgi:serine/threonine protein kinase
MLKIRRFGLKQEKSMGKSVLPENLDRALHDVLDVCLPVSSAPDAWATSGGPSSKPEFAPGSLPAPFGDYELLEVLGRGGMGVVYKAREAGLGRTVALKMILHTETITAEMTERFHREAQAAAGLNHPHLVPVYAHGEHQGIPFFTMAYIDGANLEQVVKQQGVLSAPEAVRIMLGVADAIGCAHRAGIVHRDLKPSNVLIDRQSSWPRLMDFGLAKWETVAAPLTDPGQILGTPLYMSPEQVRGDRDQIGPLADVYGLGGLLYFLLTGQPPFQGSWFTVMHQVLREKPIPPRQLNPQAPAELEAICLKCLEKDPTNRYPSAAALVEALRGVKLNTQSSPQAQAATVLAGAQPRSWLRWVGLACGLLLIGIGFWLTSERWLPPGSVPPSESGDPGAQPESPGQPRDVAQTPHPHPNGAQPAAAVVTRKPFRPPKQPRRDFCLDVQMSRGRPTPFGLSSLQVGDLVQFRIRVECKAYVYVWTVGRDGTIRRLFPDDNEPEPRLEANKQYTVPEWPARAVLSKGVDWLLVEACARPLDRLEGHCLKPLTERQREALEETLRGLERGDTALSEKVLWYVVVPRP